MEGGKKDSSQSGEEAQSGLAEVLDKHKSLFDSAVISQVLRK